MTSLTGSYECKVDAKGRLALPMGLRKQLEDKLQEGFVLKRAIHKKCLELYPMYEWQTVMKQLSKLNRFVKKNNEFIRIFTAGVKPIEIDNSGRIQISKDLVQFASIDKNVVVSSYINIIEIWDKDMYEAEVNIDEKDFSAMTEEVMGNINIDHEIS